MRGTHEAVEQDLQPVGIIPAYAGNTFFLPPSRRTVWDHPRVCGEHMLMKGASASSGGSSPRMRGTHTGRLEFAQYVGIIPAYAGNTVGAGDCCGEPGDHPRVCGEHKWLSAVPSALAGSSPRMRGTHPDGTADHLRRGIIPAYAGNTKRANPFSNKVRDHPRVCGEHTLQEVIDWCEQGSSPRMRGTRELHGRRTVRHGIIPAYAGNTLAPDLRVRVIGDHPRVCGEHQSERIRLHVGQGSSPRMRGTRRTVLLGTRVSGIIPAYAGNTWSNAPDTWSSADHPRVCGEH